MITKNKKKPLKQVNISSAYINIAIEAKIFKYFISKQNKIAKIVVTSKKFVIFDKAVTFNKVIIIKKISIYQLLNLNIVDKILIIDIKLVLTQWSIKLYNNVPKANKT